jgi:hypothetical protein
MPRLRLAAFALALLWSTVGRPAAYVPRYDHVVLVIMENTSESSIIGDSINAPYLNQLAAGGAYFTNSFAITHPSQPNYLALFSGSTQGITDDSCPQLFSGNNLGSQLLAAGLSFAGYSESMPLDGYTGCLSYPYARKHNPWVNFRRLSASVNRAFDGFPSDFSALPTVSIVVPNLCHDMHDCSRLVGDAWLQDHIDAYAQWAQTHAGLLIVTWDEDDYSAANGNHIATIFYGAAIKTGAYAETITHYNVLRTLEDMYGLKALGGAASAVAITDSWNDAIFSDDFE